MVLLLQVYKYLIIIRLASCPRLSAKAMFDKVLFLACGHLVYNGTSARFLMPWVGWIFIRRWYTIRCACVLKKTLFLTFRRLYEGANYIISRYIISHHILCGLCLLWQIGQVACMIFSKRTCTQGPGWCLSTRHCTKVSVQYLFVDNVKFQKIRGMCVSSLVFPLCLDPVT